MATKSPDRAWLGLSSAAEEVARRVDIPIEEAKATLLDLVASGNVTAGGHQWYEDDDGSMRRYFVHIERGRSRGRVEWDEDYAFDLTKVQVEPDRLKRRIDDLIARRGEGDTTSPPAYTTEHIEFIFQTIRDLDIDYDRQPGNDEIKHYLAGKEVAGVGLKSRMIDSIATIVRLAKRGRGGPIPGRRRRREA